MLQCVWSFSAIGNPVPSHSPIFFYLPIFCEAFRPDEFRFGRPEYIPFRTKDPSSDITLSSLILTCRSRVDRFDLLARHISHTYRASLQYLAHRSLLRAALVPSRQFGMCGSRSTRPKRARQALRPLVHKVWFLTDHSWCSGILITHCRIITYVLLCGYTPFRSDDVKGLIRQTTEARIYIHDRCWKNVSDEGTRGNITGRICADRNRLHWSWAVVSHSIGLHSSPAQPRPVTWPHRRASTYPLVAYELHSADRIRPLRSAR